MTTAEVLRLLRGAVFLTAAVAGIAAAAAMAVQQRLIDPFGKPARAIRRLTEPLLAPIERRLLRTRMDPRHAPWWLIGIVIFAGILTLSLAEWVAIQAFTVRAVAAHGGSSVVYLLVDWGLGLLGIALIVRVVGSWIGASSYTPWMRPFVLATEWLLAPLRRILPSFAMMDFSPLVAWFLIQVVRSALLAAL
jgi:YggT family protein